MFFQILGKFHPQRSCISQSQQGTEHRFDYTRTSSLIVLVEIHSLSTFKFIALYLKRPLFFFATHCLSLISINLVVVYRESVNLIGYITRILSADSLQL